MTLLINLDNGNETVTNLNLANAILEFCDHARYEAVNPIVIARAMMLEMEARMEAQEKMLSQPCSYGERREE